MLQEVGGWCRLRCPLGRRTQRVAPPRPTLRVRVAPDNKLEPEDLPLAPWC